MMNDLATQGRTVLVSSHLMNEMAVTADRLIVLGRGRLIADCSVAEFVGTHRSLEEAFMAATASSVEYRESYIRRMRRCP
jgi:ABC-2 type transport system ATP-binding protein